MYDDALAATAAEDRGELILPGHGETFTGARELIERRFGMTERRADKILAALREPRTAADDRAATCGATCPSPRPTSCSPRCSGTSTCSRRAARW